MCSQCIIDRILFESTVFISFYKMQEVKIDDDDLESLDPEGTTYSASDGRVDTPDTEIIIGGRRGEPLRCTDCVL